MALRIPLEWQALSGDLQDLEGAGSQESRIAGARAVTGRWSRTGKQKNPDVVRLLESLLQLVGIFAGGPSAEGANPWVLPCRLASARIHTHHWYETGSDNDGLRFNHRGIVSREHEQRSPHSSAHAEKGTRVAASIRSASRETCRGARAGRTHRVVDGAAVVNSHGRPAAYIEREEVTCRLGAVPNDSVNHAGFRSSPWRDLTNAVGKHPLGQRVDLQPTWQVPKIPALRPAHRARQRSTRGAQGRRERRMGLSLEASPEIGR